MFVTNDIKELQKLKLNVVSAQIVGKASQMISKNFRN